MKTYRSARELQAEVERVLARRTSSPAASPLDEVTRILSEGRHYSWIGIYLVADEHPASPPAQATRFPASKSRAVVPIKLRQHVLGAMEVESERPYAFAGEERVLLKNIAALLAKFLHGGGRYLMRKAREAAAAALDSPQVRGRQPESERPERTRAAAGESRR